MKLMGKKVLLTGAGGFIGSHLTESLVKHGANVRCFIRYNSRSDIGLLQLLPHEILGEIDVVYGDICDEDAIRQASRGIDAIYHLAAIIAIPYSYIHPREVVKNNVLGTLNVLMAARDNEIERVVHTSSSEVYGTAVYAPIDENHMLQGQSPYSASKIAADKIAESFHRAFGVSVATIRPFNTYGPRQSARAVIPTIISQALGSDQVMLGSLDPLRDFTYVSDMVNAFLLVGTEELAIGEVINVGSGESISIGDLAHLVLRIVGKDLPIQSVENRKRPSDSEVMKLHADISRAIKLIGWKPTISLEVGLKETVEWIATHSHMYRPEIYEV